jgi:type IV secretory pathway VirB3-like protein
LPHRKARVVGVVNVHVLALLHLLGRIACNRETNFWRVTQVPTERAKGDQRVSSTALVQKPMKLHQRLDKALVPSAPLSRAATRL